MTQERNKSLSVTAQTGPDGALKPARTKLNTAVSNLIERWNQLLDMQPEQTPTRTTPKSKPPMRLDELSITEEIRTNINQIQPGPGDVIAKLYQIRAQTWRPQDVNHIETITHRFERWVERIDNLLNPHHWHIATPCPACNASFVHRNDTTTDQPARQPALQIGKHGCECMNCHTLWGPNLYQHLARVLGCPLPEGVLE